MPLIDLDRVPDNQYQPWESFHTLWIGKIAEALNLGVLPPRYRASVNAHAGTAVAADVSTYEMDDPPHSEGADEGGVATAVYAPPAPPLVSAVEYGALDIFEVRVYSPRGARALVAAIELVSTSNKNRPAHREAFVTKCAAFLQQNVSVIVVDVTTERLANLHDELMDRLQLNGEARGAIATDLYACAYRTAGTGPRARLEMWPFPLTLGQPLPTVPMWVAPRLAYPLDLETSFQQTCRGFCIQTGPAS